MRLTWSSLGSFVILSVCSACEVHIGTGDFDASFWDDWDWQSDRDKNSDPWESPRIDSSVPQGGSKAPGRADDDDKDAGSDKDAAVSGDAGKPSERDAAAPASMLDAAIMNPDTPDEPKVTLGMVAEVLARGSCGALEKCMGDELLLESLRGVDCVDFRTQVYANRELYWLAKSVAFGRTTFRPDLLSACERDLIDSSCDVQSSRMPKSCRDALSGKAHEDESCAIDQECAGDAYCNKGLTESCPASCAPLQASGLPCLASSECADGLVCRKGLCATPLKDGDKCTVHLGFGECSPGLICQGASSDKFTCRKIEAVYVAKDGETCDTTDKLCERGLVCQSQSGTSLMGKCAKPVAAGGTCKPSEPGQCPSGSFCKDARAEVSTRAAAGTNGICTELPADGASCIAAIGCTPGAICSRVDGKCHKRAGVGQDCVEDAQCYTSKCSVNDEKCSAPLDCGG